MPAPRTGARERSSGGGRRRASHSSEAVISEAVALLDEAGETALTFRALAARLGGGVASIYWYVIEQGRAARPGQPTACLPVCSARPIRPPRATTRSTTSALIAIALFDAIAERPWLGAYFMRDTGVQPNAMLLYERLGQQVLRLELTPRQSFHAVSAVLGFVVGIAADLGQQPPPEVLDGTVSRDKHIERFADQWRALDPEAVPVRPLRRRRVRRARRQRAVPCRSRPSARRAPPPGRPVAATCASSLSDERSAARRHRRPAPTDKGKR